jgi:hypothetical protein
MSLTFHRLFSQFRGERNLLWDPAKSFLSLLLAVQPKDGKIIEICDSILEAFFPLRISCSKQALRVCLVPERERGKIGEWMEREWKDGLSMVWHNKGKKLFGGPT